MTKKERTAILKELNKKANSKYLEKIFDHLYEKALHEFADSIGFTAYEHLNDTDGAIYSAIDSFITYHEDKLEDKEIKLLVKQINDQVKH